MKTTIIVLAIFAIIVAIVLLLAFVRGIGKSRSLKDDEEQATERYFCKEKDHNEL